VYKRQPYRFLIEPFAIVLLPYFAALALKKDKTELQNTLMTSLRAILLVFLPVSVGFFILRYPVIAVLLERGKFDAVSTYLTGGALGYYIMGLTLWALDIILQRFYFSVKDTLLPSVLEVITIAVHVALCYMWLDTLYHEGIALAFTVSRLLKVGLLVGFLRTKVPSLELGRNALFLGRLGAATGMMALPMMFVSAKLAPPEESKLWFEAESPRIRYWSRPDTLALGLWGATEREAFRRPEALERASDGAAAAVRSDAENVSGGKVVELEPSKAALARMVFVAVEEGNYRLLVHARTGASEAKLTLQIGPGRRLEVEPTGSNLAWHASKEAIHLRAGQHELTLRLEAGALALDKFLLTNLAPEAFTPIGAGAEMTRAGTVMDTRAEGPAGMLKNRLIVVAGGTLAGVVVFLGAIWLLRIEELQTVIAMLRRKKMPE